MIGHLSLTAAALFAGAAIYINIAEHPARLGLEDRVLLTVWKTSYKRGFAMQATLAVVGFLLGVWQWHASGDWRWLLGAVILVGNWPFTLLAIMPTNNRLMATAPETAGPAERQLLVTWGRLHGVRSALGAGATVVFLWALS